MDPVTLVYLGATAVAVALIPGLRNIRFVGFVCVIGVAFVATWWLPGSVGIPVRIGGALLVTAVMTLAETLGLGSMTRHERALDGLLEKAERRAESQQRTDVEAAMRVLETQLASEQRVDTQWLAGLRIQRRAWLAQLGISSLPPGARTPPESFRAAARDWLSDLRLRRTIGFRPRVGPFDEAVALRTYFEDVRAVLPAGSIGPDPAEKGTWIDEVRSALQELAAVDLQDHTARDLRSMLLELLSLELEMHLTAPTAADHARYDALSTDVGPLWRALEAPWSSPTRNVAL